MVIDSMTKQTHEELDALEAQAKFQGGSLAVEVVADATGKFCGNGVRYATAAAAVDAARSLADRWMLVTEWRIVGSHDSPNR
jgi:hypothetical protein